MSFCLDPSATSSADSTSSPRSWSGNSRYLLTASRDWNVIIWDLSAGAADTLQGERTHTVRFDAPVTSAALHPRNRYEWTRRASLSQKKKKPRLTGDVSLAAFGSKLLVVTLHGQTQPVFVDLREEGGGRWELEPPPDEDEVAEDEDEEMETIRSVAPLAPHQVSL